MNRYLSLFLRRLIGFAGVMIVLSVMIFVLARIVPGDPARIALGPSATQQQVEALRLEMGLDDPLATQYMRYIGKAVQGDFGTSLISGRHVSADIAEHLPATLELVLFTLVLITVIAVPLGVITARYRNSWIDNLGRFSSIVGVTAPAFLFAILFQIFAAHFMTGWPIIGRIDHGMGAPNGPTGLLTIDGLLHGRFDVVFAALQYLLLPGLALAMAAIGQITRITRSAMIEHQRKDHALTLRSFGVPDRVVTFRYLLKLSAIAPLTIMGLEFASLIGSAFVVELVFSWGGFASYGLEAILQKDLNAVIAVVLVSGFFFVVANLVIDIILALVDPRLGQV